MIEKLAGVHPSLVKVVEAALAKKEMDFIVTEGVRAVERQKMLYDSGKSKTMNSKHLIQADGYSHACDLAVKVNGKVVWDWPSYRKLADLMKRTAKELNVNIECGADWKTFPDGPHFQLKV